MEVPDQFITGFLHNPPPPHLLPPSHPHPLPPHPNIPHLQHVNYNLCTTLTTNYIIEKKLQKRKNVLSDIFVYNVLSEHHSSLNLTTTPHYVLMSDLPTYLPPYLPPYLPQKGSLIFLKLGTLKVHNE